MLIKNLLTFGAVVAVSLSAHAATLTQWNFNSVPPDANPSTGTLLPSIGAGSASVVGTALDPTASSFRPPNPAGVGTSSDPASVADDSALAAAKFPAQGTGDKTSGVQFLLSTVGYQGVAFSYDIYSSSNSPNTEVVQYTTDGSTWIDAASFTLNSQSWFNGRTVDLSAIAAADNNPLFGLRVVAGFGNATGYVQSSGSNYVIASVWDFDMVTVSATPLVSAVPEPSSYALLLAGLAVLGCAARRRKA